jgi:hypothetical protein
MTPQNWWSERSSLFGEPNIRFVLKPHIRTTSCFGLPKPSLSSTTRTTADYRKSCPPHAVLNLVSRKDLKRPTLSTPVSLCSGWPEECVGVLGVAGWMCSCVGGGRVPVGVSLLWGWSVGVSLCCGWPYSGKRLPVRLPTFCSVNIRKFHEKGVSGGGGVKKKWNNSTSKTSKVMSRWVCVWKLKRVWIFRIYSKSYNFCRNSNIAVAAWLIFINKTLSTETAYQQDLINRDCLSTRFNSW